jgi:hypothetical protein
VEDKEKQIEILEISQNQSQEKISEPKEISDSTQLRIKRPFNFF